MSRKAYGAGHMAKDSDRKSIIGDQETGKEERAKHQGEKVEKSKV